MSEGIRNHLRSNIIGYIALFAVVISGTATALPGKKKVDHNDLQKHVVHTGKIHKGAVKARKIAAGAVKTAKIADGAVTDSKLAGPAKSRWAFVVASGEIFRSSGAVSVNPLSDGFYSVQFEGDLSDCSSVVSRTAGGAFVVQPAFVWASAPGSNGSLVVVTADQDGTRANHNFTVQVIC